MNHTKQITILSIAVSILFVLVLFLLYLNIHKSPTSTSTTTIGIVPTETVSPTTDPTADWKTYTNNNFEFSFKYPSNFSYSEKADPYYLISSQPLIKIDIHTVGNPVSTECLKLTHTETNSNLLIQRYSFVSSAKCGVTIDTDKEILVTNTNSSSSEPGIIFSYSSTQATESEKIFNQILPTFKLTDVAQSLIPADSDSPAAGICAAVAGPSVTVTVGNEDNVASPRCVQIASGQMLNIVNNSLNPISLDLSNIKTTIQPGKNFEFPQAAGSFLAPGVHQIVGAEIWLK